MAGEVFLLFTCRLGVGGVGMVCVSFFGAHVVGCTNQLMLSGVLRIRCGLRARDAETGERCPCLKWGPILGPHFSFLFLILLRSMHVFFCILQAPQPLTHKLLQTLEPFVERSSQTLLCLTAALLTPYSSAGYVQSVFSGGWF